jgi:RNA polymerase sigma-70 factor (ECF subfamily)
VGVTVNDDARTGNVTRSVDIIHERSAMRADEPLGARSDGTLVERSADGDTDAFAVLVRRYGPIMRAYAARILGGDADADDVVQDATLLAWQRIGDVDDPDRVRSWLFRITANKAVDRLRRRHPHQSLDAIVEHADAQGTEHVVAVRMQVEDVARALRELPDGQRAVWVMREIGGASYADIEAETGLPLSTVRGMLARARRTVLERMEGWR